CRTTCWSVRGLDALAFATAGRTPRTGARRIVAALEPREHPSGDDRRPGLPGLHGIQVDVAEPVERDLVADRSEVVQDVVDVRLDQSLFRPGECDEEPFPSGIVTPPP